MSDASAAYSLQTAHALAVSDCHKYDFAQLNCSIADLQFNSCFIGGCNQMSSGLTFMYLVSASVVHTMTLSGMLHASHTGTMTMQLFMPLSLSLLVCYYWFKCEIPQLRLFDAVSYTSALDSTLSHWTMAVTTLLYVCKSLYPNYAAS